MEFSEAVPFLEANHRAVVSTHQAGGGIQNSIVVAGPFRGQMGFVSVWGKTAKVRNLRRDPRCSVLTVTNDRCGARPPKCATSGATLAAPC